MQGCQALEEKERPEHWQNTGSLNKFLLWIAKLSHMLDCKMRVVSRQYLLHVRIPPKSAAPEKVGENSASCSVPPPPPNAFLSVRSYFGGPWCSSNSSRRRSSERSLAATDTAAGRRRSERFQMVALIWRRRRHPTPQHVSGGFPQGGGLPSL